MTYDPRELGAKCDSCPLGPDGCLRNQNDGWVPIKSEIHEEAAIAAVMEMPSAQDVTRRQLLSDGAGGVWRTGLTAAGLTRKQVSVVPVMSCRPPGKASGVGKKMEASLKKRRKMLKKDLRSNQGYSVAEADAAVERTYPHPADCCRPRMLKELLPYRCVYTLGGAGKRVLQTNSSMSKLEGDMVELPASTVFHDVFNHAWPDWEVRILPTLSPGLVSHKPAVRPQFIATMAKGLRWFNDMTNWADPELLTQPTPDELREWLRVAAPFWVYDVETDGINVMDINVDCLAIATPDLLAEGTPAMPWQKPAQLARSVGVHLDAELTALAPPEEKLRVYPPSELAEIREVLIEFFLDETKLKVGHNAGYFDRQCIEHCFGVTPVPVKDTLFDARFKFPDLPKGLKPTGRRETDVHRWETTDDGESSATGRRRVKSRMLYCQYDTTVNARIEPPLRLGADNNGAARPLPEWAKPDDWDAHVPWDLRGVDHARQRLCVDMHKNGIYVDQGLRSVLEAKFTGLAGRLYKELQDRANTVGIGKLDVASVEADDDVKQSDGLVFKPGSYDQVREILYDKWRLGKPYGMDSREFYTDTGLPGTGDEVLRAHMSNPHLTEGQREFLLKLRQYRRVQTKVLGTQLKVMRPMRDGGKVHPDGRVRSNWGSHTTSVGRFSSSGPNMQNQSSRKDLGGVRSIYCAAPGHVLVGCDLDSAHLVVTANYWKIERLLECFAQGKDPHCWLAHDIFKEDFEQAAGWGSDGFSLLKARKPDKKKKAGQIRELIKAYRYSSIYWAEATTKHGLIRATEFTEMRQDENGVDYLHTELPYLKYDLQQVRFFDMIWHETEPDWMVAWTDMQALYTQQGYMEDPLFGRRSGSLNAGKKNEVVNFPIIACEAAVMSTVEQRVRQSFPFQKWGPGTGIVAQVHDSIIVEVPEHLAEWARDEMTRCMTLTVPGWPVTFTCEADIGRTWAEV